VNDALTFDVDDHGEDGDFPRIEIGAGSVMHVLAV
jgi:hypothetical protein